MAADRQQGCVWGGTGMMLKLGGTARTRGAVVGSGAGDMGSGCGGTQQGWGRVLWDPQGMGPEELWGIAGMGMEVQCWAGRGQVPMCPPPGTQRGSAVLGSPCRQLARSRGRALGELPALLALRHRAGSKDRACPALGIPARSRAGTHPAASVGMGAAGLKSPKESGEGAAGCVAGAWAGEEQRRWLTVGVGRQRGCGAGAVPRHGGPAPTSLPHRLPKGPQGCPGLLQEGGVGMQGASGCCQQPPSTSRGLCPMGDHRPPCPIPVWAQAELALPSAASRHAVGVPARRGTAAPFP